LAYNVGITALLIAFRPDDDMMVTCILKSLSEVVVDWLKLLLRDLGLKSLLGGWLP
jgi:hypothetical protein